MRNFKSWSSRDRVSLLANTSPPPSPSPYHPNKDEAFASFDNSYDTEPDVLAMDKEIPPSAGAIQFVPAYQESISPATTQPPTSPDDSYSSVEKSNRYRRNSHRQAPPPAAKPVALNRGGKSKSDESVGASSSSLSRTKGTRIARLASLFSSRAIVKSMSEEEAEAAQQERPAPASPPRSESSSGYVGWPGTQDKRGATVVIESSYEESDHGKPQWTDEEPSFESSKSTPQSSRIEDNAADFYLAEVVADASAAARSPMVNKKQPTTEAEKVHRMATPLHSRVQSVQEIYGSEEKYNVVKPMTDPWGLSAREEHEETLSDFSTGFSKTSSAYFNPKEVRAMDSGHNQVNGYNRKAAAAVMRFNSGEPQPPTEEALALKDHFAPPHRTMANAGGFRGLLDKAKDVPNLMDGSESDSTASTTNRSSVSGANYRTKPRQRRTREDLEDQILEEASSDIFDGVSHARGDGESDIFDGLSNVGSKASYIPRDPSIPEDQEHYGTLGATPRNELSNLNVVLLGGGLTTIQTTANHFTNRQTASDFDENLTNSDYDQYGFARIPGFNEMASAGMNNNDRSLSSTSLLFSKPSQRAQLAIEKYSQSGASNNAGSESGSGSSLFSNPYAKEESARNASGSLEQYYVHPDEMKILVRKFRKMSSKSSPHLSYDDLEREEDSTKAFALSEMRSRIMEMDIERGLERRGGTTVVDDLVLTPYNRAAMRVRDALIVAKAWRDGATPQDVVNTSLLTQRAERAYFVPRPANRRHHRWDNTRSPDHFQPERYTWEEVLWVDDLEMSQYKCHSIGPRHLRGFEMFTIGDCQSILLKLCNERCLELRLELNEATGRQIEAEDMMKEEADFADDGMMTEVEMTYLTSMEEVKIISHKLVVAEKAFTLVRDRIEKLVAKYEALLVKFENDTGSVAASSMITSSSYYSDYSDSIAEERERDTLARRAQRAELRAELAAREAMLAKQEARTVRQDKEKAIHVLQERLHELQSESSTAIAEREHSVVLARAIAAKSLNGTPIKSTNRISQTKIEDVKMRFRNRSAARVDASAESQPSYMSSGSENRGYQTKSQVAAAQERHNLYRAVGEEMFQHLDFYERSLKAVEGSRMA